MSSKNVKVGNTPLKRVYISPFDGLVAYIKDESANAYGTIKDRRCKFIVHEASRLRVDKLALITAGNNAYSMAKLAHNDIKVVAIVDRTMPEEVKTKLQQTVYQVIEVNLQHKILRPEEVITFAREREDEVIWDVTNGYEESYIPLVIELKKLEPDYLVVPVGSGGIYVGVVDGVQRYRLKTKVIGVGVQNTLHSFADKLHTPWTPYTKVMQKFQDQGNPIYRLSETEVRDTWQKYQNVVRSEPSSTVVFAALEIHPFKKGETIVFINSGKTSL